MKLSPFAECPGDQTCDGNVDTDDLLIVINNWGDCPSSGPCPGDLNEDGTVDTDDLLIVVNNWGTCDAGSSGLMGGGGGGSGEEEIFEVLQGLGLPSEVLETIQEGAEGFDMDVISDPLNAGSFARGVSDSAHTVGWARDENDLNCKRQAVYWALPNSNLDNLSDEINGDAAWAEGVNNPEFPAVVGWNEETGFAVLWEEDSLGDWTATDLNDPDVIGTCRWEVLQAHDVNDSIWIAAIARDLWSVGTPLHAILLIPDEPCAGDFNNDSVVDVDDQIMVINNWGTCDNFPTPCSGDGNCDGVVDVDDLLLVINNWGDCPIPSLQDSFGGSGSAQGSGSADTPEEILELLAAYGVPQELIDAVAELLGL